LWAAWYGGGVTEDRNNHILVATSPDTGKTWSPVRFVVDPDGDGPVRAFDPCLWHDPKGRLWLFWAQGYAGHTDQRSGVWAVTTLQSDGENPVWSEPLRICDGIMMNKPIVLSSGEWLLPVARWRREGSARVHCSSDQGVTWAFRGQATVPRENDRNCDEHMVVELMDGRLWMLVRTTYGIGQSLSVDQGRTWSAVEPSAIPHPTSRFFVRRLQSGNILLVKHGPMNERTERSHLTAFLSEDDGHSWVGGLVLDERSGVSYPDGAQAPDGVIYLIYDYDRRGAKEILMTKFAEHDVLRGTCESELVRRRVLVNKATAHNPNGTK
jgi:predicted neuraminidase